MQVQQFLAFLGLCFLSFNGLNAQNKGQLFVFESDANGFNTKTFFYDDGKEVVAFDAQFTNATAQQALDFLKTKTNNPVKYLVISHPNPDKFNGIATFKQVGAKVIMSNASVQNIAAVHNYKKYYFVEIAKMFSNETYPALSLADSTFQENCALTLANGGKVVLKEINQSGVSTNLTVAHIPALKSLLVGDLVHHKAHAWLEGAIINNAATFNAQNWINSLQLLQKNYPQHTTVYGGRGVSGKLSAVIPAQIKYLKDAQDITKAYLQTVGNDKNKVDYKKLQAIFEQKYPQYQLGYMIAYGAYGLVASL